MRRLKILFTSLLMLLLSEGRAQNSTLGKYTVTAQPLQLLVQDIPFNIERTFRSYTIGILLAYRFKTDWDKNTNSPYYNFNHHQSPTQYSISDYESYTLGLNCKHYFKKKNRCYLEAQAFYRHWWQNNEYEINFGGVTKIYFRDKTDVFGIKFLIGHTSCLSKKGTIRFILHKYCGISIRERINVPYENSISLPGATYYYRHNTAPGETGRQLGIQLGLSLGISIHTKNKIEE